MKKILARTAFLLALAEVIVILLSWLLSAALPNSGIRSVLSGEGLRWFMGHFSEILATPLLVWLILGAMAAGCLRRCGLSGMRKPPSYRERRALIIGSAVLMACVTAILLLTVIPHAVLLSATGDLFPSPFSWSLIPVLSFSVCAFSITYGTIAGRFQSLTDIYDSLIYGIRWAAPCIIFYVLAVQLCASVCFVFC